MKENLKRAAILSAQFGFAVAQYIGIPKFLEQTAAACRRQEVFKQILSEKLFTARTAQHLYERVICIHHPPTRITKECALLNAVEEIPVAPFRFHLLANVDEHVDRVGVRPVVLGHFRRRHQEAAILQKFDWSFDATPVVQTEGTESRDFFTL